MYGLINQALKELVQSRAGNQVWSDICATVGVSAEDFDAMLPYEDSLTYRLVSVTSATLAIPATELLRMFGLQWVEFTARHGYGEMMDLFGRDLKSCLKNLNRMHGHMGAMMPDLHPPRFIVEEGGEHSLTLHYHSPREGLAPLVVGILEGLAKKFHENVQIKHIAKNERSDHDEFEVAFVAA